MSAKHTPGPWAWTDNALWGAELEATHDGKTCLECGHSPAECGPNILGVACDALCGDGDGDVWAPSEADKRLIAAAPDLLQSLLDLTPMRMPAANASCHAGLMPQSECTWCQRIARAHAALAKATGSDVFLKNDIGSGEYSLEIDATIVGPVVELRYGSHGEAVHQLRAIREQEQQRRQLLEAALLLLDAEPTHMTHRNAKERLAYEKLRAAVGARS